MIKIDCIEWLKDQFMKLFYNKQHEENSLIQALHEKELHELDAFRKNET